MCGAYRRVNWWISRFMFDLLAVYMLSHARIAMPSTSRGWQVYVPMASFLGPGLPLLKTVSGLAGCVTKALLMAFGPVGLSA